MQTQTQTQTQTPALSKGKVIAAAGALLLVGLALYRFTGRGSRAVPAKV